MDQAEEDALPTGWATRDREEVFITSAAIDSGYKTTWYDLALISNKDGVREDYFNSLLNTFGGKTLGKDA